MADENLDTPQLHDWLTRMQAGDRAARDELLRLCSSRLERLARKMLRRFPQVHQWEETADVLQNALLRLLRALQDVRPATVRDFFGLAAEQIRRELLDLGRHYYGPEGHGSHQATSTTLDTRHGALQDPPDSGDDLEDLEKWCEFHEKVAELPTEEREVVGLIFYHGWTQAEVAKELHISDRTVRRYWSSAMEKLSVILREKFRSSLDTPND